MHGISRELVSLVRIGRPFASSDVPEPPFPTVLQAIWDTGAMHSCISAHVADGFGLDQLNVTKIAGVTGTQECRSFLISLHLNDTLCIPELEVTDIPSEIGCDVIIGMDVIAMGDFAVSNVQQTVFTFRMPSLEVFDFSAARQQLPVSGK